MLIYLKHRIISMQQDDKLVTIYKACGQPEAEVIKGRLIVEGIPAILQYESLGSVYGLTIDGLGQVNVRVPAKYESKAREVIEDSYDEDEPD